MPNTVTIGGTAYVVEPFSARKAVRALRILRDLDKQVPAMLKLRADFVRRYGEENAVIYDRAAAHARYGENLAHMKQSDWEASGNQLKMPRIPTTGEVVAGIFADVFDHAELLVIQLLALAVTPNDQIKRLARSGELNDTGTVGEDGYQPGHLSKLGDELLDGSIGDLLELAVLVGETIDGELRDRMEVLGDRAGKALRVFGVKITPSTPTEPEPQLYQTTITRAPTSETPEPMRNSSGDTAPAPSASPSASESWTSPTPPSPTSVS